MSFLLKVKSGVVNRLTSPKLCRADQVISSVCYFDFWVGSIRCICFFRPYFNGFWSFQHTSSKNRRIGPTRRTEILKFFCYPSGGGSYSLRWQSQSNFGNGCRLNWLWWLSSYRLAAKVKIDWTEQSFPKKIWGKHFIQISTNGFISFGYFSDDQSTLQIGLDVDWPTQSDPALIAPYMCKYGLK